jgi:hypothetical protein
MKKQKRLLSLLLSAVMLMGMLSINFSASAENTAAVWNLKDEWGGAGWGTPHTFTPLNGYEGYSFSSTADSSETMFQWGLNYGFGHAKWDNAKTADGMVFAVRIDNVLKADESALAKIKNVELMLGSTDGKNYSAYSSEIKADGSVNQIVFPWSSFTNGGNVLDPATISGSYVEIRFYTEESAVSINGAVSYLYAYNDTADTIALPEAPSASGNTKWWFNLQDTWGGNMYANPSGVVWESVPDYDAKAFEWSNAAASNFQIGMGSWGYNTNTWRTTLAKADGIVFAIRLDSASKTDDSNLSELDISVKLPVDGTVYVASQSSIKTNGTVTQVVLPFSSFKNVNNSEDVGIDPANIGGSGDIQIELNKWAWAWSNDIKSIKGMMSYLYGYAGSPEEIELPALKTAPVASFDNGEAAIEANENGEVTLPETTVEGKQVIGWQDQNGELYHEGDVVVITEDTDFDVVAAAVDIQTGAGIRWAKDAAERGIRFETYIDKAALDTIGSSSYELGTLILPYADYNEDITVETAATYGAVNVVDTKVYGTVGENYRYYAGVVDFEKYFGTSGAALADLKLTAVSYIKVIYDDGTAEYFYDKPDATDNVRSVAEVARAALADTDFGYTDAQKEILELYTKYSEETSVPEYRKDTADKIAG